MNDSILIFACDHRKNVQWDLPYIRLGNYQSDAAINIKDDTEIAPYQLLLSEGAQMWWVAKHLNELGNPDYIGFCHYRRFFSFIINQPIINITKSQYQSTFCAKPCDILNIIKNNSLDCISFIPLQVTSDIEHKFIDIKEQLKFLSVKDKLGITDEIINKSFELLFQNCYDEQLKTKLIEAMKQKRTYVCNIFVLKRELFMTFANIVFPTFKQLKQFIPDEQLKFIHPRFMGYILERFTSMFLYAFQMLDHKFSVLPLLTIDAQIHEKWETPK